jgi:hypothetical protein
MAINGLNHFNIIAPAELMETVRDFYINVVGLSEGYRPDFGIAGHWLYAGDAPVLHLAVPSRPCWAGRRVKLCDQLIYRAHRRNEVSNG